MKNTVWIFKGLPGSGKTTNAKQSQAKNPNLVRINKDDLRAMLNDGKWSRENEKFIIKVRDMLIELAVENGKDVVVDDTNLGSLHEDHISKLMAGKAYIGIQTFDISLDECIKRDSKREGKARVGEKVIRDMYNKYLKPPVEKYVPDQSLPYAIICDIDGTLAHMGNRSPFEWGKVGIDTVNEPVANIVDDYYDISEGTTVILLSGRDSVCRPETQQWLHDNGIRYHCLYMRPEGSMEKDCIVKRKLFDDHVRDKYNVLFVLDDRNQVVEMWRDLGLTCLQVAPGDF